MTDTNKVDVEPCAWMLPSGEGYDSAFRDHSTVTTCTGNPWTGWIPLVPATALAALRQENERHIQEVDASRDRIYELEAQLAGAQAEVEAFDKAEDSYMRKAIELEVKAARYRNALVGMMACTLRADCPPDIYDAAEKALKGDVCT